MRFQLQCLVMALCFAVAALGQSRTARAEEKPVPPVPESKPFVEIAQAVAGLVAKGDWETFEKERLVDRKSYISYYEKRHKISVEERGWREYLDGMRRNFDEKHKVMADPALTVTRVEPGKEGDFPSAEVWATFRTADPEKPGSIVLQFIRIKGKWRVTSLE